MAAMACGPSFQAVYECNVRFEHCYALDHVGGAVSARTDCWRDWLHEYTYGQPRDRVEYAATRFSELSLEQTLPNEDVKTNSRRRRDRTVVAPVPTSAFAPPPNMLEGRSDPDPPATNAPPSEARAPGGDCSDGCGKTWNGCRSSCKDKDGCDTCDKAYRTCMHACFHDESGAKTH